MEHYKANVIVEKRRNKPFERILYLRQDNIIEALNITKKVKAKKLNYIIPITREEYYEGVKSQ